MKTANEIDRLVVKMSSFVHQHPGVNFYPLSQESTVFLVQEQITEASSQWSIVSAMEWWYRGFGQVCCDRAMQAEDGLLLVHGQQLKAEAYLKLWRQAGDEAISFEQMIDRGFTLVATISLPASYVSQIQHKWKDEHRAFRYLRSPNIIDSRPNETVWRIELDGLESLMEYAALSHTYFGKSEYQGDHTPSGMSLHMRRGALNRVSHPDLFAEAA